MVNRIGNTICFELVEQLEYGVMDEVTLESAFQTAHAFDEVAKKLIAHVDATSDDYKRGSSDNRNALCTRAARLDVMSKQLFGLLGPEIAESAAVLLYPGDDLK